MTFTLCCMTMLKNNKAHCLSTMLLNNKMHNMLVYCVHIIHSIHCDNASVLASLSLSLSLSLSRSRSFSLFHTLSSSMQRRLDRILFLSLPPSLPLSLSLSLSTLSFSLSLSVRRRRYTLRVQCTPAINPSLRLLTPSLSPLSHLSIARSIYRFIDLSMASLPRAAPFATPQLLAVGRSRTDTACACATISRPAGILSRGRRHRCSRPAAAGSAEPAAPTGGARGRERLSGG